MRNISICCAVTYFSGFFLLLSAYNTAYAFEYKLWSANNNEILKNAINSVGKSIESGKARSAVKSSKGFGADVFRVNKEIINTTKNRPIKLDLRVKALPSLDDQLDLSYSSEARVEMPLSYKDKKASLSITSNHTENKGAKSFLILSFSL